MVEKEKRHLLIRQLKKLKKEGLRVFVSRNEEYCYGLLSDGMSIVSIYMQPYFSVFALAYKYVPTRKYGDGISLSKYENYNGDAEISRQDFQACVCHGKGFALTHGIKTYKDLDMYMRDKWYAGNYIEL